MLSIIRVDFNRNYYYTLEYIFFVSRGYWQYKIYDKFDNLKYQNMVQGVRTNQTLARQMAEYWITHNTETPVYTGQDPVADSTTTPVQVDDDQFYGPPAPPELGGDDDEANPFYEEGYPHSMFDCATGQEYIAYTEDDHNQYEKLGYVHDLSECNIENGESPADYSFLGLAVILGAAGFIFG